MSTEAEDDYYIPPESGWCCFWCGEVFPPYGIHVTRAREHFGITEGTEPGCVMKLKRGEAWHLQKIRELEEKIERLEARNLRPGEFRGGVMLPRGHRLKLGNY